MMNDTTKDKRNGSWNLYGGNQHSSNQVSQECSITQYAKFGMIIPEGDSTAGPNYTRTVDRYRDEDTMNDIDETRI